VRKGEIIRREGVDKGSQFVIMDDDGIEHFYGYEEGHPPRRTGPVVHLLKPKQYKIWCNCHPDNAKFTIMVSKCTCRNCIKRMRNAKKYGTS